MEKINNVELGLFRLDDGREVFVKKENLGSDGCNFFVYEHISNEEDDLKPGDIIEDKYLPLECGYFKNPNTTLSEALQFFLPLLFVE